MPMSPRLLRPISTTHPEAADWANRVRTNGGTVSASTLNAVGRFCRSIDAAGIRDRFYRLNLFCGTGLNAALVPLYLGPSYLRDPLGPELWSPSTPSINNFGGSSGAWDGTTLTMSNSATGTNGTYPRFTFAVSLTVGKRYAVSGLLTGDLAAVNSIRLASSGATSNVTYNSSTGVFSSAAVPAGAAQLEFLTDATLGSFSVSIASLSIREVLTYGDATDTNNGPFVSGDYAETGASGGLTGNGTSKYLDTGLSSDDYLANSRSGHLSVYHSQPTGTNVQRAFMGASNSGNFRRFYIVSNIFSASSVQGFFGSNITATESGLGNQVGAGAGHRLVARTAADEVTMYLDATSLVTTATNMSATDDVIADEFYVAARNNNGTADYFSNSRTLAYSVGLGMTSDEVTDFYTAMQAFQTALSRNL